MTQGEVKSVKVERHAGAVRVVVARNASFWVGVVLLVGGLPFSGFMLKAILTPSDPGTAFERAPDPWVVGVLVLMLLFYFWLVVRIVFEGAREEFHFSGDAMTVTTYVFGRGFGQSFPIAQIQRLRVERVYRIAKNGRRVVRLVAFSAGGKNRRSRRDLSVAECQVVFSQLAQLLPAGALSTAPMLV